MSDRLIELALEALESRKTALEAEISSLRAELQAGGTARPGLASKTARVIRRRAPRSAAARKAQSERMKEYWARRRAKAAKQTGKSSPTRKARS